MGLHIIVIRQASGKSWYINNIKWTGQVVTVGVGKDYASITDALAGTTGDILILIYSGTYGDILSGNSRKIYIRGMENSYSDVVIRNMTLANGADASIYIVEWVKLYNTQDSQVVYTNSGGHSITFSKTELSNPTHVTLLSGGSGANLSTWNFRYVKWDNPNLNNDIYVPSGTYLDVSQMSIDKVWLTNTWGFQYYHTSGSLVVEDYVKNGTEQDGYGPNYGTSLIEYK